MIKILLLKANLFKLVSNKQEYGFWGPIRHIPWAVVIWNNSPVLVVLKYKSSLTPIVTCVFVGTGFDWSVNVKGSKLSKLITPNSTKSIPVDNDVSNGVVKVELQGSCSGCPSSLITLKQGVQNLLKHYVKEVNSVEAV